MNNEGKSAAFGIVKSSSIKSCFVNLSEDLVSRWNRTNFEGGDGQSLLSLCLKWTDGGKEKSIFVSWSGVIVSSAGSSNGDPVIEISSKFIEQVGLKDNKQVLLYPIENVRSCAQVCVEPLQASEWEILELNSSLIESTLLNQVRVVWPGAVIPVRLQKRTCVCIRIVSLMPDVEVTKLEEFTEVIIQPKSSLENTEKSTNRKTSNDNKQALSEPVLNSSNESEIPVKTIQNTDPSCNNDKMDNEVYVTNFSQRCVDYVKSFLWQPRSQEESNLQHSLTNEKRAEAQTSSSGFSLPSEMFEDLDLCLRVQPVAQIDVKDCLKNDHQRTGNSYNTDACETFMECLESSPSIICIHKHSLPTDVLNKINWNRTKSSFTIPVSITKVLSPKEKLDLQTASKSGNGAESRTEQTVGAQVLDVSASMIVTLVVQEGNLVRGCLPGHVMMNNLVRRQLGAGVSSIVRIQGITHNATILKGLILHPVETTAELLAGCNPCIIKRSLSAWVQSLQTTTNTPLIFNPNMLLRFLINGEQLVEFLGTAVKNSESVQKLPFYELTLDVLESIEVVVGASTPLSTDLTGLLNQSVPLDSVYRLESVMSLCPITELGGIDTMFNQCLEHLLTSLAISPIPGSLSRTDQGLTCSGVLIYGPGGGSSLGCGKTSLAQALSQTLRQWPALVHVQFLDCLTLRGKRVENIKRILQQAFSEAAWCEPAVLVLDNLDQLIPAPAQVLEAAGETMYNLRLAQVLMDLFTTEVISHSKVAVIATCRSHNSLHPCLTSSHNHHMFQCCVELQQPDIESRLDILNIMLKQSSHFTITADLREVAKKTEGFTPRDLKMVVERALHARRVDTSRVRGQVPRQTLTDSDFADALHDLKPVALRGVTLHTPGELGWKDVGGMMNVKNTLMEVFEWPTKYAKLFSQCPLRPCSGVLLYGPPGTGKTLLAGVVARECGLNFISIKGPELLSKYIGASEQAVRDLFTRAQSAHPCVLFFDEFDSLAPKRGHDSTGVTDRVVNQLLTQLDGVEGLEGVYVLAATSRPDLIDPALLRPGRLDKCIYCGMPNQSEQLEILQVLSSCVDVAEDVNLSEVSESCTNFTGADIKALLYNAQLEAIHRFTGDGLHYKSGKTQGGQLDEQIFVTSAGNREVLSEKRKEEIFAEVAIIKENYTERQHYNTSETGKVPSQESSGIVVSQNDLIQAVSGMVPSVGQNERTRYQSIYKSFLKSRGGQFESLENVAGQRATLA